MVDQVTNSDSEQSLADMLLEQMAEAEKKFRSDLKTMEAELSRLSTELKALGQELAALKAAPGDHQKEIAEIEKKIAENQLAVDTLVEEMQARMQVYKTQFDRLSAMLAELNKLIEKYDDKVDVETVRA